jgi:excisionase family DNA binding protein
VSQSAFKSSQAALGEGATLAPLVGNQMRHLVRSVLAVVPLADALEVFSEFVQDSNESAAMLAVATLRGEEGKPLIESRSGPSNSTEEAGERLGKTAETVRNWIEQGRLVAYRAIGDRTRIRLPIWQFDDGHGVRPWVSSLIAAYGANGWSLLDFVTVPRSSLGGAPFLHRLLGGNEPDIAEVVAAARRTNPT